MKKVANKHRGFTLIELMITLAIAVILLTVAVPSFRDVIRNNRTATNANNLVSALNLARSEAIKRGEQITMRRKGSTSQNWDSGWDVFTDLNADGTLNGADLLLRTYDVLSAGYSLRTGGTFADWVAYLPSGMSRGSSGLANDTFRLCDNESGVSSAVLITRSRAITVSISGRPRTQTGTVSCP